MKRKSIIYLVITAVVLGGLFFVGGRKRANKAVEVKTSAAQMGEIKSYLSTTATIESKTSKEYYGLQAKILKVNVKVGDRVNKGDVLITYEPQDLSASVKQAELQYDNAVLQRNDLYNQNKEIKDSISDLDKQISQLEKSSNPADIQKLETLKQQRKTLSPISDEKLKQADNAVSLAKLSLDSAKDKLAQNQSTIVAEYPGVVTDVSAVEGSMGSAMQPAVVVMDTENLKAIASLGKADADRVQLGQAVVIKSGNKTYEGKVSFIDPAAKTAVSASGNTAALDIEIDILDKAPDLKIGFDTDIDILTAQSDKVIKVPAESIKYEKGGKSLIYVVEGNTAHEKSVVIGIQSDMEVEIKDGIKEGDKVILNPSASIKDGVKVKEYGGN